MADDIELVIKIPNGAYNLLKTSGVDWLGAEHILDAVANGTPLPNGRLLILSEEEVMTEERERAIETLKENLCAMCAYGSQNMETCDIRGCDNRDAIKVLEQDSKTGHCEEAYEIKNEVKDLSKRVEAMEKQMKEDKEEQIKKLKAEIEYAKFRCDLPIIQGDTNVR